MSSEFERFLQTGPDIIKERDREVAALREEEAAKERARANHRKQLEAAWVTARGMLHSVIGQVNSAFSSVATELRIQEEPKPEPAIARMTIGLYRKGCPTGHSIQLNISGIGKQQVISSRDHNMQIAPPPSIEECSASDYATLLMAFLEPHLRQI